jgi:response regulator RpfG family c-di-GMP phosphodiesterase
LIYYVIYGYVYETKVFKQWWSSNLVDIRLPEIFSALCLKINMRIPHGRTINLLMVAIKRQRQKQKILLLNIANAWCRWNCDHVIAIAIGY